MTSASAREAWGVVGALHRREFLRRCLAAGISLPAAATLLEACGSSAPSSPRAGGSPAKNQTLTIGVTQDEYVTSGTKSYVGMYPLNVNTYETLFRLDPDYSVSPLLALRSETRGSNTFRFHLRPGVKFHDGTPFGAADVKYTFDRIASGGGGLVGLGLQSTRVIDNLTVDVTPAQLNRRVVEQVVHPEYSILKAGTQPGPEGPGTGPFRWKAYVRQSHVSVVRNDAYWARRARASGITFTFVPDSNSRSLALAAGQIDVAVDVARPSVPSLRHRPGVVVVSAPVGAYTAVYVNIHGRAPYTVGADPAVRLAIETGIDRKGLIGSVFDGLAEEGHTLVPAPLLGSSADLIQGFSYDPARARAALDGAGWKQSAGAIRSKHGVPLQLVLVNGFPDAAANSGVPEFLQANLRQIGVGISIRTEPDTDSYSAALSKGAGDLFLESGNQNDANPAFLPQVLFYGVPPSSYSKLFGPGPSFDDRIRAALDATSSQAVKQDTAEAIHQIEDVSRVFVQLAGIYRIFGVRSDIRGLVPHPSDVNQQWTTLYRTA